MTGWLLAACLAANAADLATTEVALHRGAVETNPLAAPAIVGVKAAGTVGEIVLLLRLRKRHPRLAWAVMGLVVGANGYLAWHNLGVIHQLGRHE